MQRLYIFNKEELKTKEFEWIQQSKENLIGSSILDVSDFGILKAFYRFPITVNEFLITYTDTSYTAIHIGSGSSSTNLGGIAYDKKGNRIYINNDVDWQTIDFIYKVTVNAKRVSGNKNIPLPNNGTNYIYIEYLPIHTQTQSVSDVDLDSENIDKNAILHLARLYDGYKITIYDTAQPDDGLKLFLGTVAKGSNLIITSGRRYFGQKAETIKIIPLATPPSSYSIGAELTLKDHINALGTGSMSITNPHALTIVDIGGVESLIQPHQQEQHSNGIIDPNRNAVDFNGDLTAMAVPTIYLGPDYSITAGTYEARVLINQLLTDERVYINGLRLTEIRPKLTEVLGGVDVSAFILFDSTTDSPGTYSLVLESFLDSDGIYKARARKYAGTIIPSSNQILLGTIDWVIVPPNLLPSNLTNKVNKRIFGSISKKDLYQDSNGNVLIDLASSWYFRKSGTVKLEITDEGILQKSSYNLDLNNGAGRTILNTGLFQINSAVQISSNIDLYGKIYSASGLTVLEDRSDPLRSLVLHTSTYGSWGFRVTTAGYDPAFGLYNQYNQMMFKIDNGSKMYSFDHRLYKLGDMGKYYDIYHHNTEEKIVIIGNGGTGVEFNKDGKIHANNDIWIPPDKGLVDPQRSVAIRSKSLSGPICGWEINDYLLIKGLKLAGDNVHLGDLKLTWIDTGYSVYKVLDHKWTTNTRTTSSGTWVDDDTLNSSVTIPGPGWVWVYASVVMQGSGAYKLCKLVIGGDIGPELEISADNVSNSVSPIHFRYYATGAVQSIVLQYKFGGGSGSNTIWKRNMFIIYMAA